MYYIGEKQMMDNANEDVRDIDKAANDLLSIAVDRMEHLTYLVNLDKTAVMDSNDNEVEAKRTRDAIRNRIAQIERFVNDFGDVAIKHKAALADIFGDSDYR